MKQHIGVVLFDEFETLDVFGPVEILGRYKEQYELAFISLEGGIVSSSQGVPVMTKKWDALQPVQILVIPGGAGTRREVGHKALIDMLKVLGEQAEHILTICTGSAVLAKTGLLNGLSATSNKRAFGWVREQNGQVNWVRKARWVHDGKYYTSSGVSAGIDMALGFIADQLGKSEAERTSREIEYEWQQDKDQDHFYHYYI